MTKEEYYLYLHSEQWREIRNKVIARDNCTCRICGGGAFGADANVHHLTYRNIGNEDLKDLVTLCPDCHTKIHKEASKFNSAITFDSVYNFLSGYSDFSRSFIDILGMTISRTFQQNPDITNQTIMDIRESVKQ